MSENIIVTAIVHCEAGSYKNKNTSFKVSKKAISEVAEFSKVVDSIGKVNERTVNCNRNNMDISHLSKYDTISILENDYEKLWENGMNNKSDQEGINVSEGVTGCSLYEEVDIAGQEDEHTYLSLRMDPSLSNKDTQNKDVKRLCCKTCYVIPAITLIALAVLNISLVTSKLWMKECVKECRRVTSSELDLVPITADLPMSKVEQTILYTSTPSYVSPLTPLLILNVKSVNKGLGKIYSMLPLSDGVIVGHRLHRRDNNLHQVLLLDSTGRTVKVLKETTSTEYFQRIFSAFVTQLDHKLFIVCDDGKVVEVVGGKIIEEYKLEAEQIRDATGTDKNHLAVVEENSGSVFTYRFGNNYTETVIEGLHNPKSVSMATTSNATIYVVCEETVHRVSIYNDTWGLKGVFGSQGTKDGEFRFPRSAVILPDPPHHILVADLGNHRISEFTKEGLFVKHLIQVYSPHGLKYRRPFLWVNANGNVRKYKIK